MAKKPRHKTSSIVTNSIKAWKVVHIKKKIFRNSPWVASRCQLLRGFWRWTMSNEMRNFPLLGRQALGQEVQCCVPHPLPWGFLSLYGCRLHSVEQPHFCLRGANGNHWVGSRWGPQGPYCPQITCHLAILLWWLVLPLCIWKPEGMLHSICHQIWKTQQRPQDWKRSVFIPIPKKGNAKEYSNYCTIALISHASKVMLKSLQARLQQ